jgi:hypothetical protein
VLGFVGFENPEHYEQLMHERFAATRCSGKEFFEGPLLALWEALAGMEDRSCACDVEIQPWAYEERIR